MDSVALFRKAGVGVLVPEWCDVWLVRGTVAQLDERLQEKVEVLDEVGGVRLDLMLDDAQKPEHWPEEEEVGGVPSSPRAGAVLVDSVVLWKGGAAGADVGQAREVEGVVVSDDQ